MSDRCRSVPPRWMKPPAMLPGLVGDVLVLAGTPPPRSAHRKNSADCGSMRTAARLGTAATRTLDRPGVLGKA